MMTGMAHAEVDAAAQRIGPHVRVTPVIEVGPQTFGTVEPVVAKLELLQHTGSFKPRGAFNMMLSHDIPDAGVIAASGGNHGLAVAYAARSLGVPAEIFVPEVSPEIKVRRLHDYGATVHVIDGVYDNAAVACQSRASESGALMVHAYNTPEVVAGQGTMAREIERQVPDVDTVLIAAGGGGLGGGAAQWFGADGPRLVIVEPETSRCFHAAKTAGEPVAVTPSGVAVDSLGAGTVGDVPFAALVAAGAESVLVSDEAIVGAQRTIWDQLRLIAEPGGAAAAAALLAGAYVPSPGERLVVVICGSNCDPASVTRTGVLS